MADLIVNDKDPRRQYTVSDISILNYVYDFEIFNDTDLAVYLRHSTDEPDPTHQKLTLYTDYTVTGAGVSGGGYISIQSSSITLVLSDILIIERDLPIDRTSDFSVGGQFTPLIMNNQLDRIVMQMQQIENLIKNRGLTYSVTDYLTSGQTSLPKLDAGEFWKANSLGNLVAATLEENPDWSTLRSELANNTVSAPGADLIGYYDATEGQGATTVNDFLTYIAVRHFWNTGDIKLTGASYDYGDDAPTGWVWLRDLTIGDATSGATERANDDCETLFKFIWNRISNADAPIYTNLGVATTRGATANDDWISHKRILLGYFAGRGIGIAGNGAGLTGRELFGTTGEEKHAQTKNELIWHDHDYVTGHDGASGTAGYDMRTNWFLDQVSGTGGSQPFNIMQPTVFTNAIIKL